MCTKRPNNIIDINYQSNKGSLIFWITTENKEITIGFTGDNDGDWHTHMTLFGATTPDEELEIACYFLNDIINDRKKIIHSSIVGYHPTDNVEREITNKAKEEILEVFNWSDI